MHHSAAASPSAAASDSASDYDAASAVVSDYNSTLSTFAYRFTPKATSVST